MLKKTSLLSGVRNEFPRKHHKTSAACCCKIAAASLFATVLHAQAVAPLLWWNFENCPSDQPVEHVDALAEAMYKAPLEGVESKPMAVDDGPSDANPPLTKSAKFDTREKQFLRSLGLGKPFVLAEGQPFTVEAWIKVGEDPAESGFICSNRDPSRGRTGFGLYLQNKDGQVSPGFIVTSWDESVNVSSPEPVEPAKWHHVAATRDEMGVLALYLDGREVANSRNKTQPGILDGYVNMTVGTSPHTTDAEVFWNGQIAAVRVSDSVLGSGEFLLSPTR